MTQYSPDGRWWWDGTEWKPVPEKKKRGHGVLWAVLGGGGGGLALILIIVIAVAASPGGQPTKTHKSQPVASAPSPTATPAPTPTPTAKPKPAPAAPRVILAPMSGNGTANTGTFSAPNHWKLVYSYDCSSLGSSGNFQVFLYKGDDLVNILANELGDGVTNKSVDQYTGGSGLHLEVNSECSWTIGATTA